jgi:D-alanyl-D-alanine carboxypeptidase/D-alanyl-D-alanine-endopeptidase (penicillin-binding protein 4)
MYRTAAAGNLRAKTGTIHGVSSLSGYVTTADGERLAFSIIANGVPSTAREKRSEDAIGERLARFSRN